MSEPSDEIRAQAVALLTGYLPADMWREDVSPFALDNKIVLTRQEGGISDNVIRRHNVTVMVFTGINATNAERKQALDDASLLLRYFLTNYTTDSIIDIEPVVDVSGPFQTGQNRYLYQFTVSTKSNFMRVS